MIDLNDVKGGKYQLVAVRWDQITSKPGEPLDYVRHRKGAIVELTAEDAKRLVAAGAVVKPGELERTKAEQAKAIAERAAADYQAIMAGLPEDVRNEVTSNHSSPAGTDGESGEFDPAKGGGVKETLVYVGDDKDRAAEMLQAEIDKGEKARSSLVEQLEAIVGQGA